MTHMNILHMRGLSKLLALAGATAFVYVYVDILLYGEILGHILNLLVSKMH